MTSSEPVVREIDCVVVGGGAAGLSAAVNLGRMRRSVLLVDERDRYIWQHTTNNYLGFPDGIEGREIRRLGWRHATKYSVQLLLGPRRVGDPRWRSFPAEDRAAARRRCLRQ